MSPARSAEEPPHPPLPEGHRKRRRSGDHRTASEEARKRDERKKRKEDELERQRKYDEEMAQKEADRLLEEERRQAAETVSKKLEMENEELKVKLAQAVVDRDKILQQKLETDKEMLKYLEPKEEQPDEERAEPKDVKNEPVAARKSEEDDSEDLSTCFMFSTFNFL